jgi:hypothetical protein
MTTPGDLTVEYAAAIAALGGAGAAQFDPVRFHYIEALAQRRVSHQGEVRHHLDSKLTVALTELNERFTHAQSEARNKINDIKSNLQLADEIGFLEDQFSRGNFKTLHRRISYLEHRPGPSPLAELTRYLNQHSPEAQESGVAEQTESPSELKAIRYFRNTWSKLSVDKQIAQAMEQAPENAGPLNSHYLVLRSLELMREISPDYLNRFMSYADTLLCLEQAERKSKLPLKKAVAKTKASVKKR